MSLYKDGEELLEDALARVDELEDHLNSVSQNLVQAEAELKLAIELLVKAKIINDAPTITEQDLIWASLKYT